MIVGAVLSMSPRLPPLQAYYQSVACPFRDSSPIPGLETQTPSAEVFPLGRPIGGLLKRNKHRHTRPAEQKEEPAPANSGERIFLQGSEWATNESDISQKNPHAYKNQIGTAPPPRTAEKAQTPGAHKIGTAISGPRVAGGKLWALGCF